MATTLSKPLHAGVDMDWLARVRDALGACRFLPGHPHKRFVRDIQGEPIEALTVAQRAHMLRLSRQYRRQMPADLVASEALCSSFSAAEQAYNVETALRRRGGALNV